MQNNYKLYPELHLHFHFQSLYFALMSLCLSHDFNTQDFNKTILSKLPKCKNLYNNNLIIIISL